MMHIAYEITPNTPTAVTHTSFPPYSHWDSPLPPFATVWLGKENFRSSGPLKIKVRNLPTCDSFFYETILVRAYHYASCRRRDICKDRILHIFCPRLLFYAKAFAFFASF